MSRSRVPYAGVATRAVALGIDTLLSEGIFIVGAALLALVGSLVGEVRPAWLVPILAGLGWFLTVTCYFVGFWSVTGQTPGMRLMHLRVVARDGAPPRPTRAVVRLVGLGLAIVPLFAGFLPILIDDRRRGLADFLAGTFVVYADREVAAPELEPDMSLATSDMSGQPS
jgi:uncharacterized RDD family membrane protein YckC